MREDNGFSIPAVGGSSLLVIFAVLCLTVFALLGLSTVQADLRLSQTTAQGVSDYYRADTQAEEILARLRCGQIPEQVREENGIYSYVCPISETQQLEVAVEAGEKDWNILRWQVVSLVNWEADEHLNVWDGETIF